MNAIGICIQILICRFHKLKKPFEVTLNDEECSHVVFGCNCVFFVNNVRPLTVAGIGSIYESSVVSVKGLWLTHRVRSCDYAAIRGVHAHGTLLWLKTA